MKLNAKPNKKKKKMITFIVIIIFVIFACSTLTLINRKYFFIEKSFKNVSSLVNSYIISNAYSTNSFSENLVSSKISYLQKENNELRKNLELQEKSDDYVIGEITNHTAKNWFNIVEISKGYNDGIKKDDAVINSEGLVGFVSKVSGKMSEIKLLTSVSQNNMLSVTIETNDGYVAGVLSDYDVNTGLFKVDGVMSKSNILAGDKVTLSGYDNESYKGIYVGMVVKEESSNYGLNKTIWVESSVNFDDLMFVAVVKEKKW